MDSGVPNVLTSRAAELLDFLRRHPKGPQQLEGKAADASVDVRHLPHAQLLELRVFWPRVA